MAGADDIQSKASDLLKKVITAGIGGVFLTEDALKNLLQEIKLPKELFAGILDTANRTKKEFLSHLSSEIVGRVTDRVDPKALLEEMITKYDFEFNVKIGISPKGAKKKKLKDEE